MKQTTRKLMTVHKALHSKYDIDTCREKNEEEDSPTLDMFPYEDSRTTLKSIARLIYNEYIHIYMNIFIYI